MSVNFFVAIRYFFHEATVMCVVPSGGAFIISLSWDANLSFLIEFVNQQTSVFLCIRPFCVHVSTPISFWYVRYRKVYIDLVHATTMPSLAIREEPLKGTERARLLSIALYIHNIHSTVG